MNFTYVTKKPKRGAFGNLQPDGTWDGMIGELITKEADVGKLGLRKYTIHINLIFGHNWYVNTNVAFGPIAMSVERSSVITPTYPFFHAKSQIFIENPKNAINYAAFTEPLQWTAWLMVGVFALLSPIFLYMSAK